MNTVVCNNKKIELISVNEKPICLECPACHSKVQRIGPMWMCSSNSCVGTQFKKIQKWVKKRDIMYLGDSNLKKLWEAGVVTKISDLYSLTSEIMEHAGFGQRMYDKILEQIEKSRTATLPELIGSLSIDMLGRSETSNLVGHGIDNLDKWRKLTEKQIEAFPGYQATKARRISQGLRDNWDLIENIINHVSLIAGKPKVTGGKFSGTSLVVCLTGSMSRSRKAIAADIEAAGHVVSDRVSKELTHLCQADPDSVSSKSKKAKKMGIPIISEKQLVDMLR